MFSASQLQSLEALARSLLPSDAALVERVRLAGQDPDEYVRRHAAELRRLRRMTAPSPDLPFVAFLDHLNEVRAGVEIDWSEEPGVALTYILELRRCPSGELVAFDREMFEDLDEDDSLTVSALLPEVAARLSKTVALRLIELESDSFFVVLLDPEHVPEVQELAHAAGVRVLEPSDG